jgi:hypothetical protein
MENIVNAQQKKTWITPCLMIETVEGTEGKGNSSSNELLTLAGPS